MADLRVNTVVSERDVDVLNRQIKQTILLIDALTQLGESVTVKWERDQSPSWLVLWKVGGSDIWGAGELLHEALASIVKKFGLPMDDWPDDS